MKVYISALQTEKGWLGLRKIYSKHELGVVNSVEFRAAFSAYCDALDEKNTKLSIRLSNGAPQYVEQVITDEVTSRSHYITSLNLSKTALSPLQKEQNNAKNRSKITTTALVSGLMLGVAASVLFYVNPFTILAIALFSGIAAYSRERYSQRCASFYDTKGKLETVPQSASERNALKIGVDATDSDKAYLLSFFKLSALRHPVAFEAGKKLADQQDISLVNKIRKL
jgi:hypothetical protein